MSENRKEPRKKIIAFTPVYDLQKLALLGYVGDLTLSGVMVIGERQVAVDEVRTLRIEFPNNLPDVVTTHIMIPARSTWCRQEGSSNYFNIGFEFTEIKPEHLKLFQAILERYQFREDFSDID